MILTLRLACRAHYNRFLLCSVAGRRRKTVAARQLSQRRTIFRHIRLTPSGRIHYSGGVFIALTFKGYGHEATVPRRRESQWHIFGIVFAEWLLSDTAELANALQDGICELWRPHHRPRQNNDVLIVISQAQTSRIRLFALLASTSRR